MQQLVSFLSADLTFSQILQKFSFWVILLAAALALAFLFKKRLAALALALYLSFFLISFLSERWIYFQKNSAIVIFLLLILVFLFWHKDFLNLHWWGSRSFWKNIVLGFLLAGLFFWMVLQILGQKEIATHLTKSDLNYFQDLWWSSLWLAGPILFLLIFNQKQGD